MPSRRTLRSPLRALTAAMNALKLKFRFQNVVRDPTSTAEETRALARDLVKPRVARECGMRRFQHAQMILCALLLRPSVFERERLIQNAYTLLLAVDRGDTNVVFEYLVSFALSFPRNHRNTFCAAFLVRAREQCPEDYHAALRTVLDFYADILLEERMPALLKGESYLSRCVPDVIRALSGRREYRHFGAPSPNASIALGRAMARWACMEADALREGRGLEGGGINLLFREIEIFGESSYELVAERGLPIMLAHRTYHFAELFLGLADPAIANGEEAGAACPICLGEEGPLSAVAVCGSHVPHRFHVACIRKWLVRKAECPACRRPLPHGEPLQIVRPPFLQALEGARDSCYEDVMLLLYARLKHARDLWKRTPL